MSSDILPPLIASVLAACVTATGILVIRRFEAWGKANVAHFICFAAGVLISVSLLHIVPVAIGMSAGAPAFVLCGYLLLHFVSRLIATEVCDRPTTAQYAIGLVPLFGIGLHSFIDGAIYSVTFNVETFTGIVAALGMILHEFPEGIVTYLLLLHGGIGERNAFRLALAAAAVSTPLGTLASFPFVYALDPDTLGALLALSAGALLYVGATHLLPYAERIRYSPFALVAGILVAIAIVLAKP